MLEFTGMLLSSKGYAVCFHISQQITTLGAALHFYSSAVTHRRMQSLKQFVPSNEG